MFSNPGASIYASLNLRSVDSGIPNLRFLAPRLLEPYPEYQIPDQRSSIPGTSDSLSLARRFLAPEYLSLMPAFQPRLRVHLQLQSEVFIKT